MKASRLVYPIKILLKKFLIPCFLIQMCGLIVNGNGVRSRDNGVPRGVINAIHYITAFLIFCGCTENRTAIFSNPRVDAERDTNAAVPAVLPHTRQHVWLGHAKGVSSSKENRNGSETSTTHSFEYVSVEKGSCHMVWTVTVGGSVGGSVGGPPA
eukprot:913757_1